MAFLDVSVADTYSASHVERHARDCRREDQETDPIPRVKIYPAVLRPLSRSSAKAASVHPSKPSCWPRVRPH